MLRNIQYYQLRLALIEGRGNEKNKRIIAKLQRKIRQLSAQH